MGHDGKPLDMDGLEVPECLESVFGKSLERAREALRAIRRADYLVAKWADEEPQAAYYCHIKALVASLRCAKKLLSDSVPGRACRECGGAGGGGCQECMGVGFLPRVKRRAGDEITERQEELLKKRGIDTEGWTKAQATKKIDEIALTEGWGKSKGQKKGRENGKAKFG